MSRKRSLALTPKQLVLHSLLLTSVTGREICTALRLKPSQLANQSRYVYAKLNVRDRVDLMGQALTREVAWRLKHAYLIPPLPAIPRPPAPRSA